MVKFAVFGSSVVARLNTFCTGDMKNRGECNCFGLGGMKAEHVSDSLLVKLRLYAPNVVFIHIGSNDISKDSSQGRIQDFKLGEGALKKIAPSGGRRQNVWGISCEKSRFYPKKSYFFQLRREARKLLRYFV